MTNAYPPAVVFSSDPPRELMSFTDGVGRRIVVTISGPMPDHRTFSTLEEILRIQRSLYPLTVDVPKASP